MLVRLLQFYSPSSLWRSGADCVRRRCRCSQARCASCHSIEPTNTGKSPTLLPSSLLPGNSTTILTFLAFALLGPHPRMNVILTRQPNAGHQHARKVGPSFYWRSSGRPADRSVLQDDVSDYDSVLSASLTFVIIPCRPHRLKL